MTERAAYAAASPSPYGPSAAYSETMRISTYSAVTIYRVKLNHGLLLGGVPVIRSCFGVASSTANASYAANPPMIQPIARMMP